MGQREIIEYLKNNKNRWITTKEICESINKPDSNVHTCLQKLRKWKLVNWKLVNGKLNKFAYSYKEYSNE